MGIKREPEQPLCIRFKRCSHRPQCGSDDQYKGSLYNIMVEWDNGESSYEPPDILAKDYLIICPEYASRSGILESQA